jgi:hypothetical protein|nr:MAG TPA: hypothetical protein [Crassvirales sp.]
MKYIKYVLLFILIISLIFSFFLFKSNRSLKEELSVSSSNLKAYVSENSSLKNQAEVFKLTVDQLNYYNDSILEEMNRIRKELNIKDKDLQALQYLKTTTTKTDTFFITDTLFRDTLNIDTIMSDEWYRIKLGLRFPNKVIVTPTFISEKYLIISSKKETINPPKKFFLFRWFQKKHTIVTIDIYEKSPYITNEKQRFIEIIK